MISRATPSSSCLQFPLDMSRRKTEQKFIRAIHHGATAIKTYKIGKERMPKIYEHPQTHQKIPSEMEEAPRYKLLTLLTLLILLYTGYKVAHMPICTVREA